MKTRKDNPLVVYIGRYNEGEILSGPEKTAKRIFSLHSKQYKTVFVQYFFDGNKYGFIKKLFGKESKSINENAVLYTVGLFRYVFLLIHLKPDIIHIITFERFAVLTFFARLFKKFKVIYNVHGVIVYENAEIKNSGFFYSFKDKFCEKRFLGKADKIILPSEGTYYILNKYYKVNKTKLVIVPNGIDDVFNSVNRINSISILKAVILNTSAFSKSGIDFLNLLLDIIDPPIEIYSIGKKYDITSKNEKVSLYYIEKMDSGSLADFYKDKNIFLSLNSYDTFSISTAEAMAAGLVPVITDSTGISTFVNNGVNGYKFQYGDTDGLKSAIEELSAKDSIRNDISVRCREIFTSINWKSVYGGYINIYSNLLK